MNTNTLEAGTRSKPKLRLFALYSDFTAGVRAKRLLARMPSLSGNEWHLTTEMWKLDSVTPRPAIRDMIAQEAGESDLLFIAVGSLDQPDPALVQWLDSLVNWKMNRAIPGFLVGLLGEPERKVEEANWLIDQLAWFAHRTQMDFAWHPAGRDAVEDMDWLAGGVQKLLTRKKIYLADRLPPEAFPEVTAL